MAGRGAYSQCEFILPNMKKTMGESFELGVIGSKDEMERYVSLQKTISAAEQIPDLTTRLQFLRNALQDLANLFNSSLRTQLYASSAT